MKDKRLFLILIFLFSIIFSNCSFAATKTYTVEYPDHFLIWSDNETRTLKSLSKDTHYKMLKENDNSVFYRKSKDMYFAHDETLDKYYGVKKHEGKGGSCTLCGLKNRFDSQTENIGKCNATNEIVLKVLSDDEIAWFISNLSEQAQNDNYILNTDTLQYNVKLQSYARCGNEVKAYDKVIELSVSATAIPKTCNISANTYPSGGTVTGAGQKGIGTSVSLKASYDNLTFDHWEKSNQTVSTQNPYSFTASGDSTLTAVFKANLTLTAQSGGSAQIGTTGSTTGKYNYNTAVQINATVNSGYQFSGWYENNKLLSNNLSYTVTMNKNHTIEARFTQLNNYTLTLSVSPEGAGTATSAKNVYIQGETASIKATVSDNAVWEFDGWYYKGTNTKLSSNLTSSVIMNANVSLVAKYSKKQYDVKLNVYPVGAGTTKGANRYDAGSSITVTAIPNDGYRFLRWEQSSVQKSTNLNYDINNIRQNVTLTAVFENIPSYSLSLISNPSTGGNTNGSGTYIENTVVSISANSNDDYHFIGWSYDERNQMPFLENKVTMDSSRTLYANFARNEYQLTVKVSDERAGTPTGTGKYISGTSIPIGVKDIANGWEFKGWQYSENIKDISSINSTVTMPKNDITITAVFEYIPDHVHVWEEDEWKNNYSNYLDANNYPGANVTNYGRDQVGSSYTPSTSVLSPKHCPDINNIEGEPINNLYYIGEKLNLTGDVCRELITLSAEKYRVTCVKDRVVVENGIRKTYTCNETYSDIVEKVDATNIETTRTFPVRIDIDGIVLVDGNGNQVNSGIIMQDDEWRTSDYFVKEWKNVHYSENLGTAYGIITVTGLCDCIDAGHNHVQTYYIPGPKPTPSQNTELKIHICPTNSGSVEVTYQQVQTDGTIVTKTSTLTGEGGTISLVEGSSATIKAIESQGSKYLNTTTKDGNIITEDNDFYYNVKSGGDEIYVNFNANGNYNVSYKASPSEGGIVPGNLTGIVSGSKVLLQVTANSGYRFSHWEFTNLNDGVITPDYEYDKSGSGYFIMPAYDVVAVAYFTNVNAVTIEIIGKGTVYGNDNIVPSGGTVEGKDGEYISFYGRPDEGWTFEYWMTEDGQIITKDNGYLHTIDGNEKIIAVFKSKGPYNLYVSSMFGGDAWISKIIKTSGSYNYDVEEIGPDSLGKTVYLIRNVYAGDKFEIAYEVKETGYEFGFWEYKPYIAPYSEKSESTKGTIEIEMPASDLTVTAVFKKDDIKVSPKISITTNNAEWGSAWTTVNGKKTAHDEKYSANYGDEFVLSYEAKPGYYFVNWNYSTTETPFTSEDNIKMPMMDLEVMAMFSPIPENGGNPESTPDTGEEEPLIGHIVDFVASPEEGGKVPDDLADIKLGSQVTIAVTVNKGWEFAYWYFERTDGTVVSNDAMPTISYDTDGTGYFIMPDYDVKAIAVFNKKETYKLYVTHYYGGDAWTYDNDNNKTTIVYDAYVGEQYPIQYSVNSDYEFVDWEFRWNEFAYGGGTNASSINPLLYKSQGIAVMPRSDMTVTAVFKEKNVTNEPMVRISTNNIKWGDAYIVIDGTEYHYKDLINNPDKQWLSVEAGKEYDVYYTSYNGFEFTNWSTTEYFPFNYDGKYYKTVFTAPDEKVEIMAFFKPGNDNKDKFTLKVSASPSWGGNVSINGSSITSLSDISASEKVYVSAVPTSGYKFLGWYKYVDGEDRKVSDELNYSFRMPQNDLELVAKFKYDGNPNVDNDDSSKITLTVKKVGDGSGTITIGGKDFYVNSYSTGYVGETSGKNGDKILLSAIADNGSKIDGWYNASGSKVLSTEKSYQVTLENSNVVITVNLNKDKSTDISKALDSFKIVSVRDLNWKDYFVQNGQLNSERYFGIPSSNTTMLQDKNNYKQPIKMGYAVEFELITTGIAKDNADLVITPSFYYNGTSIDIKEIKDYTGNKAVSLDSKFSKITIDGATANGKGSFLEEAQDIHENVSIGSSTITDNKVLWRWIYYLPSNIAIDNKINTITSKNGDAELLVKFNIQLMENGKAKDIVVNANKVLKTNWDGRAFRYSLSESLLDDIYDNAQN